MVEWGKQDRPPVIWGLADTPRTGTMTLPNIPDATIPEEYREFGDPMRNSSYYSNMLGEPVGAIFDIETELNEIIYGEGTSSASAWGQIQQNHEKISLWQSTMKSWQRGVESLNIDFVWHAAGTGRITEAEARKITKEFEDRVKADPIKARNWLESVYLKTVGVVPGMVGGYAEGAKYGLLGAGVGAGAAAVIGQVPPLTVVPEEVATVPAGAASGIVVGQTIGSLKYWSEQGYGAIYRQAREQGVSKKTASIAAAIGGPVYGAIEHSQVDKIIPGLARLKGGLLKLALSLVKNIATEVGQEGTQRGITDGTILISKLTDDIVQLSDVSEETKAIGLNMITEMKEAIGPMAILQAPGGAVASLNVIMDASKKKTVSVFDPSIEQQLTEAATELGIIIPEVEKPAGVAEKAPTPAVAGQPPAGAAVEPKKPVIHEDAAFAVRLEDGTVLSDADADSHLDMLTKAGMFTEEGKLKVPIESTGYVNPDGRYVDEEALREPELRRGIPRFTEPIKAPPTAETKVTLKPGEAPITKPERESLRDLGYTIPQIAGMSVTEARRIEAKKIPVEKFTPVEVVKELDTAQPKLTEESKNAATVMEHYWREFNERELEISVQVTKNQQDIATALNKKDYLPVSDAETKEMSMAMMLYIDLQEHPEGHTFAEALEGKNKELYQQSQNLSANIKRIADRIAKQNLEAGKLAVQQDVIAQARENYVAHLWEHNAKYDRFATRFRQTTARAKARRLEGGIAEGLSLGLTLRVDDITLASQIAQDQVNQANVGKKLLQLGKDWGLLSHEQVTDDWVKVEHPGFTTYRFRGTVGIGEPGKVRKGDWVRAADRDNLGKITDIHKDTATVHFVNRQTGAEADIDLPLADLERVRPSGQAFFISPEGVVLEKVPVYAEPKLGKTLNNVFSPSAIFKIPGAETVTRYNAIIKSTILYTSLFHHQAYLRSYAFGSRGINAAEAYKKGREAIMNMTPEVRLLVRNGMTIGAIQDYDPRMVESGNTIWGQVLALTKPTDKLNTWIQNLRRQQERFLFKKLGPFLKVQAGILELKAELERNRAELESGEITVDEIAAAVGNLMNNDFGGLHLGRMGRSNTVQHALRLLFLAPDWTESNVRSMVDAFKTGETGYMHRMFWGRIAIKGLGATVLFNLLLSSFDDDDFVERYKKAWKEGHLRWLDIDITPINEAMGGKSDARKYFSLIGHFRDPVKFVRHPGRSLKHKGSVVSRMVYDFATGQDWAGRQFTTVGELSGISEDGKLTGRLVKWGRGKSQLLEPHQLPSWFIYEGRQSMPIPIQNIASFIAGEMDGFDAVTKSLGLMTSTTYPPKRRGTTRRTSVRR